eukprot:990025-Alexandrium_andersonii.AAC.1
MRAHRDVRRTGTTGRGAGAERASARLRACSVQLHGLISLFLSSLLGTRQADRYNRSQVKSIASNRPRAESSKRGAF